MKTDNNKIDIVVTWVDGNDPEWLKEKAKYTSNESDNASARNRYRDWGTLRYWFRGIEKYAPWVNHIFFVTCGHYPEWLDLSNSKLSLVRHEDYIPDEVLPVFNSNPIEMYLYNLKDLSEQFILFNDDIFLIDHTKPEDFFINGMPCESALLGIISSHNIDDVFPHILLNNNAVLNKYFSKKEVLHKYSEKFFSLIYGKEVLRNICLLPFVYFSDFRDTHLASSHLKSSFKEVWDLEPEEMKRRCSHRFRSKDDLNHWLIKDWNMCKGKVYPRSPKWGKKFEIGVDSGFDEYIIKQKGKAICLNDSIDSIDFEEIQQKLVDAFESILPDKSSYEK